MTVDEIAKELTVALISRVTMPSKEDEQHSSKWVAEAYQIIYQGVIDAFQKKY